MRELDGGPQNWKKVSYIVWLWKDGVRPSLPSRQKPPTFYYTIFPQICQGVCEKNFAQFSFPETVQIDGNSYLLLDVNEIYSKVNLISFADGNFYLFRFALTAKSIIAYKLAYFLFFPGFSRPILKPQGIIFG